MGSLSQAPTHGIYKAKTPMRESRSDSGMVTRK